ncbi:MAG TPA: class I SAM-dependent methyltransferase [Anaerolineae bacterium]|nr:class I SAM-dependent methyltransferase [Anaerolineae bacterium]HIP73728.1 class I SAM-dependent methyltransferase [Anaerolineae bacterium]
MKQLSQIIRRLAPKKDIIVESDVTVYDVTAFAGEIDLEPLAVIKWAPMWMSRAERLLIYTLTFTLRPSRYLEIGTFQGGSALVVNAAMDALGSDGRIICVDPEPRIAPENWQKIERRASLITGYSPEALPQAVDVAGGPFDFVLIDGDHTYNGVVRDANGVLPYVADGAYLLFHDSFFVDVARGIRDFARQNADQLVDFGSLTREVTFQKSAQGELVRWGGLRMMQVRRYK